MISYFPFPLFFPIKKKNKLLNSFHNGTISLNAISLNHVTFYCRKRDKKDTLLLRVWRKTYATKHSNLVKKFIALSSVRPIWIAALSSQLPLDFSDFLLSVLFPAI